MALAENYQSVETEVNPDRVDDLFLFKNDDGTPSYYPNQRETIIKIIQAFLDGKKSVIADAPTGAGKTAIANTVMRYLGGSAFGATPKNVLVDQYANIGWKTIYGLTSYSCRDHRGHNCYKGTMLARAEGKTKGKESGCRPDCPARLATNIFFRDDGKGAMTNTSYFWSNRGKFERACAESPRQLLVFDEAHMLEAALSDMVSVTITENFLKDVKFDRPMGDAANRSDWLEELVDHLDGFEDELYAELKQLKGKHGRDHVTVKTQMVRIESVQRMNSGLDMYNKFRHRTSWMDEPPELDSEGRVVKLKIEPVFGSFLVKQCISLAPYTLFMSATFLDKEFSCNELGIELGETEYLRIPSYFPPENQPIYYDSQFSLNKSNLEQNLPHIVAKIDRILDYETGKRGIIHSHSHAITKAIYNLSRHKRRFSIVENGEKQMSAIEKHIAAKESVLLGPGFIEGVDLKGDLGEFFITPKIPFPPLFGDKKLQKREYAKPGYCNLLVARTLIQGAGRVVRGASETANGYILDGALNRLLSDSKTKDYFPDSFLEKFRSCSI